MRKAVVRFVFVVAVLSIGISAQKRNITEKDLFDFVQAETILNAEETNIHINDLGK